MRQAKSMLAAAVAALLFAPAAAFAEAGAKAVPVRPATRSADLAALPESQVLVFPNGLRMSAGQLRGLAPKQRVPARGSEMMRKPPAGPGLEVHRGSTLADLERAPPQTLLRLPDGRAITAAQLKAFDEALTRSRPATARAAPATGQAVRVPRGTPLAELLARPDSDVLESPGGKRVTVGELRRYLAGSAGSAVPQRRK